MDRAIVLGKRRREDDWVEIDDGDIRDYKFKVFLPNGTNVSLHLRRSREDEMHVHDFIREVKEEYFRTTGSFTVKGRRKVTWKEPNIYLEHQKSPGIKIKKVIDFNYFEPNTCHYLKLYDGVEATFDTHEDGMEDTSNTRENIWWDITPDTEILRELPQEYSFETALADLIDNSLQAVWSNGRKERRLVSVTIDERGLTIFDTGSGMDGTDNNCISKWGTMGASVHRSSKSEAIGGKPPYLTPYFGMFGVGGLVASMHLGSRALVSSKTKESKKVYTLCFQRDALLKSGDKKWKAAGDIRDPLEDEIRSSPHGSFTKVEIFEPKEKNLDTKLLQCRLKDIYFPYIQCDEMQSTGRTSTPVQFQVNGNDLAELEGGEIAITNWLSGNGPEFVFQIHLSGLKGNREAHARLKCVYFPVTEGKERIDMILEKLIKDGFRVTETFDTFPRVSVRRLGRLLPDARWGRLPFMESKQRKGSKAQVLKRCSMRVKCFIDTDAGFNPNNHKTDLASKDPCTLALKNLGNKAVEKDTEATIEILRGEKRLTLSQLEKEYECWIFQMHEYDHEIESDDTEDSAVVVFLTQQNQKELSFSSNVIRVHKVIKRKGQTWKSDQKLKILKGAGAGCHKNNLYATLEYILLEGLDGDACGEVRLVCRPLDVPEEKGCVLKEDNGSPSLDIQFSKTFPITIIDSGKCKLMDDAELEKQLDRLHMKAPSAIDMLNVQECCQLGIDGALAFDSPIHAESVLFKKVVAVLRPTSYDHSSSSRSLDQKNIVKDDIEMTMEITYLGEDDGPHKVNHFFSQRVKPSAKSGIQGLYIFKVGSESMSLESMNSGIYKFLFTTNCEGSSAKRLEKRLTIMSDTEVGRWKLLRDDKHSTCCVRVGTHFPCVSIACLDASEDRVPFTSTPEVMVRFELTKKVIVHVREARVKLSSDGMILNISDICIETSKLDRIRPNYRTTLVISSKDEIYSLRIPYQVNPGPLFEAKVECMEIEKHMVPGSVIKKLVLEMLDRYGNHVESGAEVSFRVFGLFFIDDKGPIREVNDGGFIDLSGVLKVSAAYGSIVTLSIYNGGEMCLKKDFHVENRVLRIASEVPDHCLVGSELKDITFEVVDSDDTIDETIHHSELGEFHILKITSGFAGLDDSLEYNFLQGKCTVPSIRVPLEEGVYSVSAVHVNHPELCITFQLHVMQPSTSCHEDVLFHTPKRRLFLLNESSVSLSPKVPSSVASMSIAEAQELENDFSVAAIRVGEHEKKLKLLNEKKSLIEQGIYELQASLEPEMLTPLDYYTNDKEGMIRQIESKVNTAASVICNTVKLSQSENEQVAPFMQDIIGIVALLGTVDDFNLSRILAEYVGEENMLAIVCKSYETASILEQYEEHGKVDQSGVLYQIASAFGGSIHGRFLVFCLDELSPFRGKIDWGDSQRRLDLRSPLMPTKKVPHGFLGYAVNFINLDANFVDTRTSEGYGLRETLFYCLFGELQVYESRESMRQASPSIKHGAVSLDGGIIKGNGVLSLGAWNPEIRFPVESTEIQSQFSQETLNILRKVAQKKLDLEETSVEIVKETQAHSEVLKEYQEKKDSFQHYMNELERSSQSQNVKIERFDDDY